MFFDAIFATKLQKEDISSIMHFIAKICVIFILKIFVDPLKVKSIFNKKYFLSFIKLAPLTNQQFYNKSF